MPEVFATPVPVRRLDAAGSIDGELSRLTLESFVVDTDRPQFSLDGELWRTDAGVGIKGRFQASDIPFDSLATYWPDTFIANGREWIVENIADGAITRFDAVLDMQPGDFEAERFTAASAARLLRIRRCKYPLPAADAPGGGSRRDCALHRRHARHRDERRPYRRDIGGAWNCLAERHSHG